MIRDSGQMWGPDGKLHDTKAVIPDRCYAPLYAEAIEDCKQHGAFDPRDHGHRAERRADGAEGRGVRLARQDLPDPGGRHGAHRRRASGKTLIEHAVEAGDIWRACQTKDVPIRDWVKLAVTARARHRHAGGLLARREPRPRRAAHREGRRGT